MYSKLFNKTTKTVKNPKVFSKKLSSLTDVTNAVIKTKFSESSSMFANIVASKQTTHYENIRRSYCTSN